MDGEIVMSQHGIDPIELHGLMTEGAPVSVLDVRKQPAYEASPEMIEGAGWRDPENVANWAGALPKDQPIVAYCTHGQEVSQGVAAALRERDLDAYYLVDGFEGWRDNGLPLQRRQP